jgi:hypothetical protein
VMRFMRRVSARGSSGSSRAVGEEEGLRRDGWVDARFEGGLR